MSSLNKRAIVWRLSSLGDIVQTWWASYGLYRLGYQVEYVVKSPWEDLFKPAFWVHRVWSYPKGAGLLSQWQWWNTVWADGVDLFWDAHDSLRSHWFGTLAKWHGSFHVVTKVPRWRRFLWMRFRLDSTVFRQSAVERFWQSLNHSIFPQAFPLEAVPLQLPSATVHRWMQQLSERKLEQPIVVAPVASYSLKNWPLELWQKFLEQLVPQPVLVVGGQADKAQQSLGQNLKHVWNLVGQTSLTDLWVLLSLAKAVVAPDTGIFHMAEVLLKPRVVLLGPSVGGFPFGFGQKCAIVEKPLPCRGCSPHGQGPCRYHRYQACLRDISPDQVLQALQRVINLSQV